MGMFDYVKYTGICFKCGSPIEEWQSKDSDCLLQMIEPSKVREFHSSCPSCEAWNVRYVNPKTLEIEDISYKYIINEDEKEKRKIQVTSLKKCIEEQFGLDSWQARMYNELLLDRINYASKISKIQKIIDGKLIRIESIE